MVKNSTLAICVTGCVKICKLQIFPSSDLEETSQWQWASRTFLIVCRRTRFEKFMYCHYMSLGCRLQVIPSLLRAAQLICAAITVCEQHARKHSLHPTYNAPDSMTLFCFLMNWKLQFCNLSSFREGDIWKCLDFAALTLKPCFV